MTRNKKLVKKIGCGLLAGALVFSGVTPYNVPVKVEAASTSSETELPVQNGSIADNDSATESILNRLSHNGKQAYVLYPRTEMTVKTSDGITWAYNLVHINYGEENNYEQVVYAANLRMKDKPTNLTKVTLPKSLDIGYVVGVDVRTVPCLEVGGSCFLGTNVTKVTVPSTYKIFAQYAFYGAKDLQEVVFSDDGIVSNEGENLVSIGSYAFSDCSSLKKAVLPEQLLNVVECSDEYTGGYKVLDRPLGNYVYQNCTGLEDVVLNGDNVYLPSNTFYNCRFLETLTIDKNTKNLVLSNATFNGCNLQNLSFDCNVISGGNNFANNPYLKSVVFNKPAKLGVCDFNGSFVFEPECNSKYIEFNSLVDDWTIPTGCFKDCLGLTEIRYPDTLNSINIQPDAFSNTGIKELEFKGQDVIVKAGGLGSLGNTTETVLFNNTGTTELYGDAFTSYEQIYNEQAYIKSDNKVKRVKFNSQTVEFMEYSRGSWAATKREPFYGLDSSDLIFGENVAVIKGYMEDCVTSEIQSENRNAMDGIKNVYILNPDIKLDCPNDKAVFPDDNYTIYAFPGSSIEKALGAAYPFRYTQTKFDNYLDSVLISTPSPEGIIKFIAGKNFDGSNLLVTAFYKDGTSRDLSPVTASGLGDYVVSPITLKALEDLKETTKEESINVIITYAGEEFRARAYVVPKAVEDFEVVLKEGAAFIEGDYLDENKFAVKNVKYNDDSIAQATLTEGVTARLKTGDGKLVKGDNVVVVSYNGVEREFTVKADEKQVSKITAKLRDESKKYYPKSELTANDFLVIAEYNNGEIVADFKDFTLLDNVIKDTAEVGSKQVVTVSCGDNVSLVEVTVSKNEVNFLLASYTGAGVLAGGVVDKKNVDVTVIYSDGTRGKLSEAEYELVYEPIIADKENEVKVVLVADNTKTTSINVVGQKVTDFDIVVSATPDTPTQPTQVPSATGTSEPEQPSQSIQETTSPGTQAPSTTGTSEPEQTSGPDVSIPNTGVTKLASTKYTLGVKEKVILKLTGGNIANIVSSNTKIATVTKKGVITAKKVGTVKIKLTDNYGSVKTVSITVKKAPKIVKANITKKTLKVGKKVTLKAKFTRGFYSNSITFSSSNKKVATVNANGVVIAKKKGKAVITLKTYNGKKVKVTITVK